MASVNKWIGIGNLGQDPTTRYMPNGEAVTNISIACTETWVDKNTKEKREQTEWVRITFYRKLAEIAGQYLKKGSSVYVEGKLQTRKWTDKDGVERYTTEIIADSMQMLGSGPKAADSDDPRNYQDGKQANKDAGKPTSSGGPSSDFDDQIPFGQFMGGKYVFAV
ncbi:MAG TPA: single-stranded DNA-binding protein [Noviherbaspirillum sp.]|nr:single-stranded DNA-binding protein [Noviherbaspirillum sp.]